MVEVQWWEVIFTGATFFLLTAYHLFWNYQVTADAAQDLLGHYQTLAPHVGRIHHEGEAGHPGRPDPAQLDHGLQLSRLDGHPHRPGTAQSAL